MPRTPATRPPCRLAFFFAEDAPVAAILRKGPTGWVCLVRWNTKTDEFAAGQWLHARVYEAGSDISPDGNYFLYYARDGRPHRDFETWTALSRVPEFTAIALWSERMMPGGGGVFLNNRSLIGPTGQPIRGAMPRDWHLPGGRSLLPAELRRLKQRVDQKRAWTCTLQWRGISTRVLVQEAIADRDKHLGRLREWFSHDPDEDLKNDAMPMTTEPPQCLFDQDDQLIYSRRGRLWRVGHTGGQVQMREVADLNALHAPVDP